MNIYQLNLKLSILLHPGGKAFKIFHGTFSDSHCTVGHSYCSMECSENQSKTADTDMLRVPISQATSRRIIDFSPENDLPVYFSLHGPPLCLQEHFKNSYCLISDSFTATEDGGVATVHFVLAPSAIGTWSFYIFLLPPLPPPPPPPPPKLEIQLLEVTALVRFLQMSPSSHYAGSHILTSGNGTGWIIQTMRANAQMIHIHHSLGFLCSCLSHIISHHKRLGYIMSLYDRMIAQI